MAEATMQRRRRPDSGSRVPPHNLDAEASLLGALLLSRDAMIAVAETGLVAGDFYKPSHQHIYEAIRTLMAVGHPVDAVTVAEELRRDDVLDEIGGPAILLELQASTPAISNATRYARIVQDTALLRRLIAVAGEIAELGYEGPDDVTKALDEAEAKVFEVAENRVTDSTKAIGDLLPLTLADLEATYERGTAVTGTATGYHDLDELLSGLQPSTLNVVGARPSMGKCIAADTEILDPATGELVTAAELYRRGVAGEWVQVLSLARTCRFEVATPSAFVDDGVKPVFEVVTRLGRTVQTTASHPFLTEHGWCPLTELRPGTRIAVPARLPWFGHQRLPAGERALLAQMLGDDGLRRTEAQRRDDLSQRSLGLGFDTLAALRRHGLWRVPEAETVVPCAIQRLPRDELLSFLERLLQANRAVRPGSPARIAYAARSPRLARGVQHLLLRFGVVTSLRATIEQHRGRARTVHELVLEPASARTADVDAAARLGVPIGALAAVGRAPAAVGAASRSSDPGPPPPVDICWDEVIAIAPQGAKQVYDLTVPGPHNFVAADVVVHNTAFALGLATHVAVHETMPVLFFSLEMGHRELTQRILAAEARVDSQKMRTGRLSEQDWSKIGQAIGRLEAPLYIDDNPNVTVMEIRAKARRMQSRYGQLGLIVVDYLQLMTGRSSAENRQVEVSEISRGLKILARELVVPIVALSQLSRNLEARQDKRPMLADLRESGCLTASTRVTRADTNAEVTLGQLVASGETDVPVWTLDEHYRLVPGILTHAFASGTKPVLALHLASGRVVEASANHPFLTPTGWARADELAVGTPLVVAEDVPAPRPQRVAAFVAGARREPRPLAPAGRASVLVELRAGLAWDPVVAVEPRGPQPVFDASVPGTHNFLANGIVAHNSIEQDADVVMFIYRDEVYNPDSSDRGMAEIIVSKHRNGPIGMKRLAFLGHYTRFDNAAKGL